MGKKRLLVIDHEPQVTETIGRVTKKEGFDVGTVSTLHEALESIEEAEPDLVLLDAVYPDHSLVRALERLEEQGDYPIILMVSQDIHPDYYCGRNQVVDCLKKPFDSTDLLRCVKRVLGQRR